MGCRPCMLLDPLVVEKNCNAEAQMGRLATLLPCM